MHEITQGVAFLHQLTPPMVHRDLNDKNVMFTFDGVVKIGDFGQSKPRHDSYLTSAQPGMVLYMPPEALDDNNSKYDESLDMFSLGVLMLEIGTQQQPNASFVGIGSTPEIKRRAKDLQKMGDLHPLKPFILLCLNDDQKQRPKAAEMGIVLSRLEENMLQTILAAENRFLRLEAAISNREDVIRQLHEKCKLNTQLQVIGRPVGSGVDYPVRKGCSKFDFTVEQIEQKKEKRTRMTQSSWYTGPSTTRGRGESDSQQAANDEDAPKCEKCRRTFPWNQLHLRWKHKCEPTEVDHQLHRTMSSASRKSASRKLLPAANAEKLSAGRAGPENHHSTEQDPDTHNVNMKDAPSCEKCGKIFPWNQRRHFWKHMQECTGSAESGENVPKATPSVAKGKTIPRSDANDEDSPKCDKCGRIFPWNQPHLRWKHKCEPTEVDHQLQQTMSSTSRKLLPAANAEQLSAFCTVKFGVRNEAGEPRVCGCGKTFADNQQRKFVIHKLQCPKGTPIHPPGAQGATLRK